MSESVNNLSPTHSTNPTYLSLKSGKAPKNGPRSQGHLHYRILTNADHQQLFITIVDNDGGGCYSKEIVPFDRVEQCLKGLDLKKPIASKTFQAAYVGKSANNAGFLCAILRAENLLSPAAGSVHQHQASENWETWKTTMLALAATAEVFQPEPVKPRGGKISRKADSTDPTCSPKTEVNTDASSPKLPEESSVAVDTKAEIDTKEDLDETDLALLQRSGDGETIDQDDEQQLEGESPLTTGLDQHTVNRQPREKLHLSKNRGSKT